MLRAGGPNSILLLEYHATCVCSGIEPSSNSPCHLLVFASPDHPDLLIFATFTPVPTCNLTWALHARCRPVHCKLAWRQPIFLTGRLRLFSAPWRASAVESTSRGLQFGCNSSHLHLLLPAMADPLTVVGAVASVVQLIHFTTKEVERVSCQSRRASVCFRPYC